MESIRRWLRSDMRVLRWVLLGLYLLVIASLFANWWSFTGEPQAIAWMLVIMLVAQALFIFGAGTIRLCRPIRKRRLVVPVVIAAAMLTILLGGLTLSLLELFELDDALNVDAAAWVFWGALLLSWAVWGVLLFAHVRVLPRFEALSRLARVMITGSLLELLASVPAHVIVTRRPGCFVGMATMMGIIAGLSVMLFAFGPALVLLFLRPRYRREQMESAEAPMCDVCGYDLRASRERCPECGTSIPADETLLSRR